MKPGEGDADWRALNLASWDERVPIHLASAFYDVDGFRRGASSLRPFELAEVGDVRGKRLVHLQCHIGLDTLSWARRGAQVCGLDFSAPAIEAARALAGEIGIGAEFVTADVYDAAVALGGRLFDIVYTGVGALVWHPDIRRWAGVVSGLLAPGGFLYVLEGHPFADVLDYADGSVVVRDYFYPGPYEENSRWSYADNSVELKNTKSMQFHHGIGDVVSALAAAGLRIDFLHEQDVALFGKFESLVRHDDGTYHVSGGRPRIPLMYSLRASWSATSG